MLCQISLRLLFAAALALTCLGCAESKSAAQERSLVILAASSTTDLVKDLSTSFASQHDARNELEIATSFAATSSLARQIRDGRQGDLFISANLEWIDWLHKAGAIHGKPIVFAENRLVCIQPANTQHAIVTAAQLREEAIQRIAWANRGVPAGDYARQAIDQLDLRDQLAGKLIGQKNVRDVLAAVVAGNVDAGIVYASDAHAASQSVRVAFTFASDAHDPIRYYAALLQGSHSQQQARAFMTALATDAALETLESHGFLPPAGARRESAEAE